MRNLKIFTNNVEQKALEQVNELLEQESFKGCKVRIMPDVHTGAGCVIGFTADLGDKVIPEVVGVDIGCGMTWVKVDKADIDLPLLDTIIRENIPSGMNAREEMLYTNVDIKKLYCYNKLRNVDYVKRSLGSLGGGNHFIELDKGADGLYLVVHSGSRNLGKQVCDIYQEKAIENCSYKEEIKLEKQKIISKLKAEGKQNLIQQEIEQIDKKYKGKSKLPRDLCYVEGQERENYLHDMKMCQEWATDNRKAMIDIICQKMNLGIVEFHETIHNYIGDDNIVRKGAISAYKDEIVLIPMNMRDGCLIAKGKGNEDWNNSAPHGAGRIMSRIEAKNTLSLSEYENEMKDIYSSSVCKDTIDESPMVYKPMQEIIDNIGATVDVLQVIKPIYNFKAKE